MKCHILFSEKNKKNISKCRLLKILPRVLSVKIELTLVLLNPDIPCLLNTVKIQISWLLQKPTDLDLHCSPLSM